MKMVVIQLMRPPGARGPCGGLLDLLVQRSYGLQRRGLTVVLVVLTRLLRLDNAVFMCVPDPLPAMSKVQGAERRV